MIMNLCAVITLTASPIDLAAFPQGIWEDYQNDARWVFLPNNIQIKKGGEVVFDFKDKIKDVDIQVSQSEIELTFRCDELRRDYSFYKDKRSTDLIMSIDKDNGVHLEVRLKKK